MRLAARTGSMLPGGDGGARSSWVRSLSARDARAGRAAAHSGQREARGCLHFAGVSAKDKYWSVLDIHSS